MIVHVPGKDGGRFLDTTSRQVDPLLAPVVSLGRFQTTSTPTPTPTPTA